MDVFIQNRRPPDEDDVFLSEPQPSIVNIGLDTISPEWHTRQLLSNASLIEDDSSSPPEFVPTGAAIWDHDPQCYELSFRHNRRSSTDFLFLDSPPIWAPLPTSVDTCTPSQRRRTWSLTTVCSPTGFTKESQETSSHDLLDIQEGCPF